jgi:hypothetical protein
MMADFKDRVNPNSQNREWLLPFYSTSKNGVFQTAFDYASSLAGQGFTRVASDPLSHRLRPFTLKDRIMLSLSERGRIFKCQCRYVWVEEIPQGEQFTIWRCEKCQGERLLRREKTDAELIEELLCKSLRSGDGTFLREMKLIKKGNGLGRNQRERLRKIALELGVEVYAFVALVPASEEGKS